MAKIARRWCETCQDMVRGDWSGPNHILHLLLSIVTVGLWLPVWLILSLGGGYHCNHCGHAVRAHRPPTQLQLRSAAVARYVGLACVAVFVLIAAGAIVAANLDAAGY